MIPYERREKMKQLLSEVEYMKIEELLTYFPDSSLSTIRRDLKKLSKDDDVHFLSGGAVKLNTNMGEISILKKNTLNTKEKEYIAELAAMKVSDGDTIYLDAGTTCLYLFQRICHMKIRIFTTNTGIFSIHNEIKAETIIIAGKYNPNQSSLTGALTLQLLENVYFDKAFLGANGVDVEKGITTAKLEEAQKKRMIHKNTDNTYYLCDSSKFNTHTNIKISDLQDFCIISDKDDAKINELVDIIYE